MTTPRVSHHRTLGIPDPTEPYRVNGVEVDPADVIRPSDWDGDHDIVGLASTDDLAAHGHPGVVQMRDLGTVSVADLLDGPVTLFTPADGEYVMGVGFLDDPTLLDHQTMFVGWDDEPSPSYGFVNLGTYPGSTYDGVGMTGSGYGYAAGDYAYARPARSQPLVAAIGSRADSLIVPWLPAHAIGDQQGVIRSGAVWYHTGSGVTGADEPDWAGFLATAEPDETLTDGDLEWLPQSFTVMLGDHNPPEVRLRQTLTHDSGSGGFQLGYNGHQWSYTGTSQTEDGSTGHSTAWNNGWLQDYCNAGLAGYGGSTPDPGVHITANEPSLGVWAFEIWRDDGTEPALMSIYDSGSEHATFATTQPWVAAGPRDPTTRELESTMPTVGSAHLYALVATPVAP